MPGLQMLLQAGFLHFLRFFILFLPICRFLFAKLAIRFYTFLI